MRFFENLFVDFFFSSPFPYGERGGIPGFTGREEGREKLSEDGEEIWSRENLSPCDRI